MRDLQPFLRLWRRHPWRLSLSLALAVLTLLASVGLLALSGWFLAAASLAGAVGLYSFNYMLPAAGVRGAAIVRTAARYFERLVSHDATFRVLQHLRVFTFSRLIALSPGQLALFRQGELLNRFVSDVDTLDHLYLRVFSPLAGAFAVILVVTFGLSYYDVALALTLGGLMMATLLIVPPLFYRLGQPAGRAITQRRSFWRLQLTRWLEAQAELRIFGAEARWRNQLDQDEVRWQQAQHQQHRLVALAQSLMILLSGLAVCAMLWLSAADPEKVAAFGPLIALFVFCALAAFEALAPVAGAFLHLSQVMASAQRVNDIISQQPDIIFPERPPETIPGIAIEITSLRFGYPSRPEPILNAFSLSLSAGEHVALLGPTGCGKTTVLALLTRAREAQQGTITLNGVPLAQWDEASLRKRISVVTQRVHLFSQTLRDNLLLAAPNATDDQLIAALQQVGLSPLLDNDEGLNAWLGEGGRPLSGGELRRLAIARALLHNGDLWLLDEPTEALDAATEQQILTLLQNMTQNKTVIMVTHRLTGLEKMERICVMDAGTVIEQGSHRELISKRGRYWRLQQRFAL